MTHARTIVERSTYRRLDNSRYTNAVRDTAPDPGSMKSASCNRVQVAGIRVRTRVRFILRAIITLVRINNMSG